MNVTALLTQISPEQYEMLGELTIGAVLSVPAFAGIKKWMNVNREFVMLMYVMGGALITAGVTYTQSHPEMAPWLFLPAAGSFTFVLSQILYYAIWKPGKKKMAVAYEEAQKLNEAKRAAALPVAE
jgi:amino acid transporter